MPRNKIIIILLILASILIIGGLYFYRILVAEKEKSGSESVLKGIRIEKIKKLTEDNINYFINKDSFTELANSKQYQNLKDVNLFLDLKSGIGNSDPFYNPNIVAEEE